MFSKIPFGVGLLMVLLVYSAPTHAAPAATTRFSEAEAIAAVRQEIESRVASDRFSGAVLIARAGKPVFQGAWGLADIERQTANTVDTRFVFGSMGKMFTGVAIMQLVQAGKVGLHDPLGKYLVDYPNQAVAAVTVHQLLTHTGGTGNIFGAELAGKRADMKSLADYVALFGERDVRFEPGAQFEYSNYGFILLGRIIEVVSGMSYADYVRDNIFRPSGMTSTDNVRDEQGEIPIAIGYTRGNAMGIGPRIMQKGDGTSSPARKGAALKKGGPGKKGRPQKQEAAPADGPLRSADHLRAGAGTSAGGGYSTIGDLLKFATALTSGKLLEPEFVGVLTTGKIPSGKPGTRYAYGFEDEMSDDGVRRFGHGGGFPGINAGLSIFPDLDYVVVVLANRDSPAAKEVERFIAQRLPRE